MKKTLLASSFIVALSLLTGCGGGGGSSSSTAPATSTSTFPLATIWINYLVNSSSSSFTMSGNVNGTSVTGSGTVTNGQLTNATFEGRAALSKAMTVTGSIVANNQSIPLSSTSLRYVDTNYSLLGASSSTDYTVVTQYNNLISNSAKVNDTAILYTANMYSNANKTSLIGTFQESFVLEPETADTAILKLIDTQKNTQNSVTQVNTIAFRVTPTGGFTRLYENAIDYTSNTNLTINY